jgi:phosphoribosylformylglycinamidine synthase I
VAAEPKALIITGDGLNCERETAHAFRLAGALPELVHITDILSGERSLADFQILALIGGFSNGDHLGAGTVQAVRFRHRLRAPLERFVAAGRPVIGICNGFQTLVKMGILPGRIESRRAGLGRWRVSRAGAGRLAADRTGGGQAGAASWERTATIMANDSGRFEDRWVRLVVDPDSPCLWTRGLRRLHLPVRHGEGKFVMRDLALLRELKRRRQIVLRYQDGRGRPTRSYPDNPNGSVEAVAGLCDPTGRIFGLMPHPEAYHSPFNHPAWTREAALGRPLPAEGQGVALFRNAVEFVRGRAMEGRV